ncbi:TetR/AcrR family transcriptional regulator [Nocardia sp. NBC_01327]|uniref:TetR/AcrR family transcriptional regulator n=1 Tax=Nocardia sp. NBC_01327 TaxID=2903593 RepID=UPI002E15F22E|nr:TetR family transcriptional regulator [Nocardia sp. NBC_01327]
MQARNSSAKQEGRTFIESARRAQIVDAAVEVIAEQGYANASFAKIAKQAGLSSTGMISYHFKGKDDLIREVIAEFLRLSGEYLTGKMDAENTLAGRLRAFIVARIAMLDEFPKHFVAAGEIINAVRIEDPDLRGLTPVWAATAAMQEQRFREGQQAGEFRDFDPKVMVLALHGAINEATVRASVDPDFDTAACGRELADLFEAATRKAS